MTRTHFPVSTHEWFWTVAGNRRWKWTALLTVHCRARAIVPSGASTGAYEALELRDGDPSMYLKGRFGGREQRQRSHRAGTGWLTG